MRVVEFVGAPGSGKSTMWTLVLAALRAGGHPVTDLDQAVAEALAVRAEDPIVRLAARTVGRRSKKVMKKVYARSADRGAVLAEAMVADPELAATVIQSAAEHNVDAGADVVLAMMFGFMGSYHLASGIDGERWLVIDEGFCNRVISLFAADYDDSVHRPGLTRYLGLIPVPEILVAVATPIDACRERLEATQWTKRMRQRPLKERVEFLNRAIQVAAVTTETMARRGAAVVEVDGTADPDDEAARVVSAVLG